MTIRFSSVCKLFEDLESLKQHKSSLHEEHRVPQYQAAIRRWFDTYRSVIHAQDTNQVALLSTLLPHFRKDRAHGMQEDRLKHLLPRILKLGHGRARVLREWKPEDDFAILVYNIQKSTDAAMLDHRVDVEQVDDVLHKLAALCRWSSDDVRSSSGCHTREDLLRPMVLKLHAIELKWFIRLIMKRVDQYVYDADCVLRMFHPLLPGLMRFQPDFSMMVEALKHPHIARFGCAPGKEDQSTIRKVLASSLPPRVGVKIAQPSFLKARSIKNCLDILGRGTWSIQEKLDGEYCQVHVDLANNQEPIKIFSKSGRDSTKDRAAVIPWLTHAFRIGDRDCVFKNNTILEGELVVWSSKTKSIQAFDRIRHHVSRAGSFLGREASMQVNPHECLVIFFYDLLVLDNESVIFEDYTKRRAKLETLIQHLPEQTRKLACGQSVNFSQLSRAKAEKLLLDYMVGVTTKRLEGLVFKSCDMPYFSLEPSQTTDRLNHCVVKLKKDYIKGLGDCEDFAIVGASFHEVDRRIYGSTKLLKWTRFNLACLDNKSDVLEKGANPIYKIVGTVGPKAMPLQFAEQISVDGRWRALHYGEHENQVSFALSLPEPNEPLTTVFKEPFFVEVLGSGFERPPLVGHYMLRHPRVVKLRNEKDRSFRDIVSFDELQTHAKAAINLPQNEKDEEAKWRQKIEEASKSRRRMFVDASSPFANQTQSTTSPQATPLRPNQALQPPASGLLQREYRADKNLDQQKTSSPTVSKMTKMLMALPTPPASSAPHERRMAILGMGNPARNGSQVRKRKRADDETTLSQQSTKRACSSEPSPRQNFRLQKAATLVTEYRPHMRLPTSRPLSDITYIAINSTALNNTTKTPVIGTKPHEPSPKENAEPAREVPTSVTKETNPAHSDEQMDKTSNILESTVQELPSSQTLGRNEELDSYLQNRSHPVSDFPSSPPCQDPAITKGSSPASLNLCISKRRTSMLTPFRNHVIYLSPCLCSYPYLIEDLMPMLSPDDVVSDLQHWSRDIESSMPSGATVSESQAYADMQKSVFVESRREKATNEVLSRVKRLRLVDGENIEVWDWRIAEALVECIENSEPAAIGERARRANRRARDELRACVAKYFKGQIRWDKDRKTNVLDTGATAAVLTRYTDDFWG